MEQWDHGGEYIEGDDNVKFVKEKIKNVKANPRVLLAITRTVHSTHNYKYYDTKQYNLL